MDRQADFQLCSRREFVVATGLFLAGTTISCSKHDEGKTAANNTTKKSILTIPTEAPVIRIRIGKVRARTAVKIGETQVSRSKGRWYTSGNNPPHARTGKSISFGPLTKCNVVDGNKSKSITGRVEFFPREDISSQAFDVVATVPVERYLPGVLAGELYAHWHPTTFAAQAIAARSYAIAHHLQRSKISHYDVSDDTSSQMFLGDVPLEVAHRAVAETSGLVLSWNNTVIPAYYSACCGGIAATATDAISDSALHDITPLFGHEGNDSCMSLEVHSWFTKRDARTLRKRLNACSQSMQLPELDLIRSIRSIDPSEENAHGRPNKLVIVDRQRKAVEVRTRDLVRAVNASVASLPAPPQTIMSSFLSGKKNGSDVAFEGYGMGHGVGLCQYGAQELAGRGRTFEDILSWYYPQAELHAIPSDPLNTIA
ncbi:MAG: SpoIID/LytB domain-containing protein [Planctomycetota bacterium]|nr:SpoIID/LytB domain-containing protein [Planctomycetota bacterium]